ncbi:MAG: ubiquinol-cytochrome c reductase iron-sulfur subunit [Candidatus Entotheonellia bacterium]
MGQATQPTLRRTAQATGKDVSLWYRRDWLSAAGWAGLFVVMMTALMGFMRYMFPRVLFEPPTTFRAGSPKEYGVGAVNEKFKKDYRVWIVRKEEGSFYALLAICTHLGCTPNWFATDNKFKCPCHGSGFYRDGTNYEGPAPRPLDRIKIALTSEGQLVVDKGVVYRMVAGRQPDEQYPQSLLKA